MLHDIIKRLQGYHKKVSKMEVTDSKHKSQNFKKKFDLPPDVKPPEEVVSFDLKQGIQLLLDKVISVPFSLLVFLLTL